MTFAAAVAELVVVGEAVVAVPGSVAAVADFGLSSLLDIAAPTQEYVLGDFLHQCPQKSEVPLGVVPLLGETLSTCPAQRGADPSVDLLAGSSPPLAFDDPLPPLRGASSALSHPGQPTEKEGPAGGQEGLEL